MEAALYKVLISDKYSDKGIERFRSNPEMEVDYKPGLTPDELMAIIGDYDALAVRSATKVTEEVFAKATKLKVVGRAGIGVDNIDLNAATKSGICVMNTPGGNTITTAEHTIAMLMSLTRNIPAANSSLKSGKWEKPKFIGTEVMGKTLGVIGLGNIGKVVASLARGLQMKVLGFDPFVSDEKAHKMGVRKATLDEIWAQSDYITVHVPRTEKTTGMINAETIAKMKDGVRILNCARGGIVDEQALIEGLRSGKVKGAALDVFEKEPPAADHPLLSMDNVVTTPHLGASTTEAQDNVGIMVADQIIDFLLNGTIYNSVNVPSMTAEEMKIAAPFLMIAERLGSMQAQLSHEAPARMELLYGGEASELPKEPIKAAALKGFMSHIAEVDVNLINAGYLASDRGIEVQEITQENVKGFDNLVGIRAVYNDGKFRNLQGAKMAVGDVRMVLYNDHQTDIELQDYLLVISNHDRPGVVGEVGMILGKSEINIANLRLSRRTKDSQARLMITIDSPAPEAVMEQIRSLPNVIKARQVCFC